jgi:hypothetical protein
VRKYSEGSIGILVRALGNYLEDGPDDLFEIAVEKEHLTVKRSDIAVLATPTPRGTASEA